MGYRGRAGRAARICLFSQTPQGYHVAFATEQGVGPRHGTHREETGVRAVDAMENFFAGTPAVEADLTRSVVLIQESAESGRERAKGLPGTKSR